MNAFEVATPASIVAGSSAIGVIGSAADGEAQPVVDGAVVVGGRAPFANAGHERPLPGRRRARARIVERQERRRATERGSDRILEEAVRMRIGGDTGVGVDVDRAWEHEKPGRVDRLARARPESTEVRLDSGDPFRR